MVVGRGNFEHPVKVVTYEVCGAVHRHTGGSLGRVKGSTVGC